MNTNFSLDTFLRQQKLPEAIEEMDAAYIWTDVETTGLNKGGEDHVLELGMALTDKFGGVIDVFHRYVYDPIGWPQSLAGMTEYVRNMHRASGFMAEYQEAKDSEGDPDQPLLSPEFVQDDAVGWLMDHGVNVTDPEFQLPMAGGTINFDRMMLLRDLPKLEAAFHYRNIDVSSLKGLCKRLNPRVYARMDGERKVPGLPEHRALNDIGASIREFRFYVDNFFVGGQLMAGYAESAILLDGNGKEMHRIRIENISVDRDFRLGGTTLRTTMEIRGWVDEGSISMPPAAPIEPIAMTALIGLLRAAGGEVGFLHEDMALGPDEQLAVRFNGNRIVMSLEKK